MDRIKQDWVRKFVQILVRYGTKWTNKFVSYQSNIVGVKKRTNTKLIDGETWKKGGTGYLGFMWFRLPWSLLWMRVDLRHLSSGRDSGAPLDCVCLPYRMSSVNQYFAGISCKWLSRDDGHSCLSRDGKSRPEHRADLEAGVLQCLSGFYPMGWTETYGFVHCEEGWPGCYCWNLKNEGMVKGIVYYYISSSLLTQPRICWVQAYPNYTH